MNGNRSSEIPRWKFLITLYCTLLVSGLFFSATALAQAVTPVSPPVIDHCIEEAVGESLNCTANDVSLGLLVVDDPAAPCTETSPGSGQFTADVRFQAELIAGARERWDIGMFIALDGGDARTGVCGRNYIPAYPDPLADPGDPGSSGIGGGVGPHYDGEEDEDPTDVCGDLPQDVPWYYDLLPIDSSSGLPTSATPEIYTIECIDTDDDGFVDVGTCTSWDNARTTHCTSLWEAYPNTKAKCNCERTNTTLVMPAFLTLHKTVVNDNGGTAVEGDFQAYVDTDPVNWDAKQVLQPGTYTASEDELTGYTASDWSGACAADGSITLESGDDVDCYITNDDDAPSLRLIKHVTNDDGGTATSADWTICADSNCVAGSESPQEVTDQAGTYTLSETGGPNGYEQSSLTCDNASGQVTEVTVGLGETVTCTFVNDDIAPTLTLVKTVVNDDGGTLTQADFPSFVDGVAQAWDAQVANTAGNHTASETTQAGYAASGWSGDCAADGSITMALDTDYTCYITNDDIAPTLTLVKTVVNDDGGTLTQVDFPSFVNGSPQAWDAVVDQTAGVLLTASETPQAGYAMRCAPSPTMTSPRP